MIAVILIILKATTVQNAQPGIQVNSNQHEQYHAVHYEVYDKSSGKSNRVTVGKSGHFHLSVQITETRHHKEIKKIPVEILDLLAII